MLERAVEGERGRGKRPQSLLWLMAVLFVKRDPKLKAPIPEAQNSGGHPKRLNPVNAQI